MKSTLGVCTKARYTQHEPLKCSGLVGGLPVAARVGVFSRLLLCGFVGLRWGLTLLTCACAFDSFLL